jgi:hypothetical protein
MPAEDGHNAVCSLTIERDDPHNGIQCPFRLGVESRVAMAALDAFLATQ